MPSYTLTSIATDPGSADRPTEDWACATPSLLVVLDGATARTETGCVHGVAWYTQRLGAALVDGAVGCGRDLPSVLQLAIASVAAQHPNCDLTHPGTPSAGVALLRANGEYLVLGDVTIVAEVDSGLRVIVDQRVDTTATAEREEADRYLIGTPEKARALVAMKRAELAARNMPNGYWIAAADPSAADRAQAGTLPLTQGSRVMLLTDGAARIVTFGQLSWQETMELAHTAGPSEIVHRVRQCEARDPLGKTWPRNKTSDDATIITATVQ